MVFYLIGLGLGSVDDVTVKGLDIIKKADRIYLEAYTSILTCGKEELEKYYNKSIMLADRTMVEQECDEMLNDSDEKDIVLLVVGDPFGATTHTDLVLRCVEKKIPYKVVHNASIMNAIGCCGLQLYSFGETVSIVFWTDTWRPQSFVDKIESNLSRGLHTLCLLDIKMKEQTIENLMKGNKIFEPPRFMSASLAASQLVESVESRTDSVLSRETMCIALSRVGSEDQRIVAGTMKQLATCDVGPPLHSLIVCGNMHPLEEDFVKQFHL